MAKSFAKRGLVGIILVVIGLVFLLDNLGFDIELPRYLLRWPSILILIGLINLLVGKFRQASLLLGLGIVFMLNEADLIDLSTYWPVILIVIGVAFIFRRNSQSLSDLTSPSFDEVAIFGGNKTSISSSGLSGGKITALFGGTTVDLRGSQLIEDAQIDIFVLFGGTEIIVPKEWKVKEDATVLLGGFEDSRDPQEIASEGPTLSIKGFAMFGGGELRS